MSLLFTTGCTENSSSTGTQSSLQGLVSSSSGGNNILHVGDTAILKYQNEILSVTLLSSDIQAHNITSKNNDQSYIRGTVVVNEKNIGSTGITSFPYGSPMVSSTVNFGNVSAGRTNKNIHLSYIK